jgi:hypothetical protein
VPTSSGSIQFKPAGRSPAGHGGPKLSEPGGQQTAVFGWPDGRVAQMLMVEPFVAFGAVKFKFDPLGG